MNLDRTYCVSEHCTCPAERRLTPEIEKAAAIMRVRLSMAFLCGPPPTTLPSNGPVGDTPDKHDFTYHGERSFDV